MMCDEATDAEQLVLTDFAGDTAAEHVAACMHVAEHPFDAEICRHNSVAAAEAEGEAVAFHELLHPFEC